VASRKTPRQVGGRRIAGGVSRAPAGASVEERKAGRISVRPFRERALHVQQPSSPPYRPRDDQGPKDILDMLDRHISRATDDEKMLKRYRELGRSVVGWTLSLMLPWSILGAGVAIALSVAGINPWVAIGSGAAGAGAFLFGGRHVWKRLLRRFTSSEVGNNDERGNRSNASDQDAA
jgi:hypothetical protein